MWYGVCRFINTYSVISLYIHKYWSKYCLPVVCGVLFAPESFPFKSCSYRRQLASVARKVAGTDEVGVTVSAGQSGFRDHEGATLNTSGIGKDWYGERRGFGSA